MSSPPSWIGEDPEDALALQKAALRRLMAERRSALSADQQMQTAQGIVSSFAPIADRLSPCLTIAAYVPMRGEADVMPLIEDLAQRGFSLALPVVIAKGKPLLFRAWSPGNLLSTGPYGTYHPPEEATVVQPDLLLIPLLAFDLAGYRLGYGGGFYDRTLEVLRAGQGACVAAVGVGHACQQVNSVPRLAHDQPLDGILTEHLFHSLSAGEKGNTLALLLAKGGRTPLGARSTP